jgi:hypothetical protein
MVTGMLIYGKKIVIFSVLIALCSFSSEGAAFLNQGKQAVRLIDKLLEGYCVTKNEIRQLTKLHYKELTNLISKYHNEPEKLNAILMAVAREKKVISFAEADDIF